MPRDSFPKGKAWRASKQLELVHSNICGPLNPISNGGKRYFITFTDDFNRKSWVYFPHEKSEAFVAFKSFKPLVEKEVGMPIKVLHSDRGGEYLSQEFISFCDSNGIHKQLTTAYTPQQNGVSERKNRTILNVVRSLLRRSDVPKSFWLEAVSLSVHVLNRRPTHAVRNRTLEEAWSGRRLDVRHFRVFNCVVYSHVPDQKRTKLDDKAENRDVVFDEHAFWPWEENNENKKLRQVTADFNDEVTQPAMEQPTIEAEQPTVEEADQHKNEHGKRNKKRAVWMKDYVISKNHSEDDEDPQTHFALFADCDPMSFDDACKDLKWREAMNDEIAAIEQNDTWELTDLPRGQKPIGVKWIYKTKLKENGEIDKYKARLVTKGYKKKFGVDYKEVYALLGHHT
ncbi:hypothetical protein GQ457_12G009340 [Hibiscus cannabinus]